MKVGDRHLHRWVVWFALAITAVTISFLVRLYAFEAFSIPSRSMEPTLQVGDRVMVSKLAVRFGTINRGDVVVFTAPANVAVLCHDAVTDLVKRVIGLPGDHLTSKGNIVYINGRPLPEHWSYFDRLGTAIGHVTVPVNHYFMMGDNRPNSCDSRIWGTVPRSAVIGKVILRVWPTPRFGFL